MANDITASSERTSILPEAAFPFFNPQTGELEHIKGKRLTAGGGGSNLPVSGGLYFDGFSNTVPVTHQLIGSGISAKAFTMTFTIVVPPKSQIKASGRGIGGISAANPASSLNSSITLGIRGTSGYGNIGTSAGDLIAKVVTATGSDLDMVIPGFCDAYSGQTVRIDITRGLTVVDFPARLYINKVLAMEASGTGTDWGANFGPDPFFFYGSQSSPRSWIGKVLQAGFCALDYSPDDILAFNTPTTEQLGNVMWGTVIGNRDSDFSAYAGFTWDNWTGDGASYNESGGGTINPPAGNANSWAHGEVNGTAAPGKLRLTAKASSGKNVAVKSGGTRGRAYRVKIKARCVSGTPSPLYFGFGHNPSVSSQEVNAGEALIFTPGPIEQTFTARIVARSSGALSLALVHDADSAGQVYEFDDVTLERDGWAVWADLDLGDGFSVPNVSNPAWDGVIPAGSSIAWASPKRNVTSCVRQSADQAVSSSTTGTALVDTGLSFRVAANAKYSYEFLVPFALAGTASGFKFNVIAPAGATGISTVTVLNSTSNSLNEVQSTENYPVLVSGSLNAAATHLLKINGVIENGATEGLVTLQMAQLVSDAATITVKKNATAEFTRRV